MADKGKITLAPQRNAKLTEEQFKEIAKAGFPEHIHDILYIDKTEMFAHSDVYRLYYPEKGMNFLLPKEELLSIAIHDENFVQIESGGKMFNHLSAINKMKELKIIG